MNELRLENGWVTVVQAYTPTTDCVEEPKTSFYSILEEVLPSVRNSDHLVVMGVFNAIGW